MSTRTLWIVVEGQPDGPHEEAAIAARLAAGELLPDTGAWHDGLAAWTTLAELAPQAGPAVAPPPGAAEGVIADSDAVIGASATDGEALESAFAALVKKSWKHYNQSIFAGRIDEVLLGALITVMVERGAALIDITSNGQQHFARFERLSDKSRVYFRLSHLTPDPVAAKVQGHLVSVIVGYGEFIDSFATIWNAVKAEYRSGLIQTAEPGTITVDGDMETRYVYVQVDLFWNAGDYVNDGWKIDYTALGADMDAALHVLRKYLRGRFRPGKEG
jgi:hypothetical protein